MRKRNILFAVVVSSLVGCGGDDGDGGGNGNGSGGSALLTIGSDSWELDNFGCAIGPEETQSDTYSFSSSSTGDHEGARVQMQVEVRDDSGQGRLEGDGVIYTVYIRDIDNLSNPNIHFESTSEEDTALVELGLAPPSGMTTVAIVGDAVTAEGLFDDKRTEDDFTQVAGTLEGTCGQ